MPAVIGDSDETARRANSFAAEAARLGMRVIYSQQISDPARITPRQRRWEDDSQLCRAGSAGAELFITPVPGSRVVRKYRYDIWQSQEVLSDWDIDGLIICGVELTCCVVSGMRSTEQTGNSAIREYLRFMHPAMDQSDQLLRALLRSERAS